MSVDLDDRFDTIATFYQRCEAIDRPVREGTLSPVTQRSLQ